MKELAAELDQEQTQTLIDYMYQTMLNIIGMPNRNGGTSTSDTGSAVIMRDGWESAEARAKLDEMAFKASETEFLKQVLMILRSTTGTPPDACRYRNEVYPQELRKRFVKGSDTYYYVTTVEDTPEACF